MNLNRVIFYTALLLIFFIIFFGISDIDIKIQNYFYNFNTNSWILDRNLEPWHTVFYSGAKKALIIFGAILLLILIIFWRDKRLQEYKKGLIIVILSAIIVPLSIGFLKKTTNMPCPKNEIHYGGKMPRTSVWQKYKEPYNKMPHIACWPAGHASGGFALLSLYFLFKSKRKRRVAIIVALIVGWAMGLYKMLIGDHFFSHTVITMLIAWLLILIIAKAVLRRDYFV